MNAEAKVASADLTVMAGATPARAARPLPRDLPGILCGRYQIERLLGVGGMGAVYRARDLLREQFGEPQPWVALKTLSEDFAEYPDASALLYSEFALTARLSQRNLVRFYSFEVDPACQRAFITMELLNSRVDHKDYMCDKSAWGIELCKRISSENFKLLFDIYHMQIDEGDIIRTIRNNHQYFGHYHTAGNPGRNDLDDKQEINYPPIMQAIADSGFKGYVSHEFLPKGEDKIAALGHAVQVCDV